MNAGLVKGGAQTLVQRLLIKRRVRNLHCFQIVQEITAFLNRQPVSGGMMKASIVPLAVNSMLRDCFPRQFQTGLVDAIDPTIGLCLVRFKTTREVAYGDGKTGITPGSTLPDQTRLQLQYFLIGI
jgi:hypothetical protein